MEESRQLKKDKQVHYLHQKKMIVQMEKMEVSN